MFTVAAMKVTTAPMETASGRSPGASGFRLARASALRSSERDGGLGAAAAGAGRGVRCFLLRLPNGLLHVAAQLGRGAGGIVGVANRTDHDEALRTCSHDRARVRRVDPSDREPRLVGAARRGVLHEL